jgi:N-acetylglucosaminyl-diphospho-decaprenol L-rhamnosyltransferase
VSYHTLSRDPELIMTSRDGSTCMTITDDVYQQEYAAIVLYYRYGSEIERTLRLLMAQDPPPTEIIVVDNDSRDGLLDDVLMLDDLSSVRLLSLTSNAGYAGGMNAGVRILNKRPEYLLFLTHESELAPGSAHTMVESANRHQASVVGPSLFLKGRDGVWSKGGVVTRWGRVKHVSDGGEAAPEQLVDWIDGACMLIRRAAYEGAGGFDERFFLYWEDVDMSLSCRPFGAVLCSSEARAHQSTGTPPIYYGDRNQIMIWLKRRMHLRACVALALSFGKLIVRDLLAGGSDRRARCAARIAAIVDGVAGRHRPRFAQAFDSSSIGYLELH